MIDSTLTWKGQVDIVCLSMSRTIGMIYKIRPYVNKKILLMIYYCLVYPHLTYAIEVWGNAGSTLINRIYILQKRIVRAILYKDIRDINYCLPPSDPLFIDLKVMKIHNIFRYRLLTFVFKCMNNLHTKTFRNWFQFVSNVHNYSTRSVSTCNLYLPRDRTVRYGLNSIKFNGPFTWNDLPNNIKNTRGLSKFNYRLKEHLLSK